MDTTRDDIFQQAQEDGIEFLPSGPGIYCITNRINGKRYIGQSLHVRQRCQMHLSEMRRGL